MDSKQVVRAFDKYFETIENIGFISDVNTHALWITMFVDEYYEFHRNNETLTDCMVKNLNEKLKCVYQKSCLFKGNRFSELQGMSHWIIPNVPPQPIPQNEYVKNGKWFVNDVANKKAITNGTIQNNKVIL